MERRLRILIALLVSWLCAACGEPTERAATLRVPADPSILASIYSRRDYDPSSDPAEDLAALIPKAKASGKRILLEVGGDWCVWCEILDRFIAQDGEVASRLAETFVILKVSYGPDNENASFLSRYPEIPGYPHFFVLESDGTLLHSQGTGELEDGDSYDREAFLAFIDAWAS